MSCEENIKDYKHYEERVVAFLDLQGFSERVLDIGCNKEKFSKILCLLKNIKTLENQEQEDVSRLGIPEKEQKSLSESYRCTALSDSIVFSCPVTEYSFIWLSVELALLQWTLLWRDNFLIRGHVAKGKCYHQNGIVFGPAFLDAYRGAEKDDEHKLPYITIQKGLLEKTFSREQFIDARAFSLLFQKDEKGRNFINYAGVQSLNSSNLNVAEERARHFINTGFESAVKPEIKAKYFWTYKYLSKNIPALKG